MKKSIDPDFSPMISIIVPLYNAENYMIKTLQSILQQTYKNFEVLMINDCSTDKTEKIASSYTSDKRFQLISLPINLGVANARNVGIRKSIGKYICFLDSDDWWSPNKLEIQLNFMMQKNYDITCMSYSRVNENGKTTSLVKPPKVIRYDDLLKSNHIGNLTSMIKKEIIKSTKFNKLGHEDYIFWLNILKKGYYCHTVPTHQTHCFYLVRKNSLSSNKLKAFKWQWIIYKESEKLNSFKAFYYLFFYILNSLKKRI